MHQCQERLSHSPDIHAIDQGFPKQRQLVSLEEMIGYRKPIDHLAFRFRHAALLFSRASTTELLGLKDAFDGFGLEIIHLMIEAESLFLERKFDQRLRLATLHSQKRIAKQLGSIYCRKCDRSSLRSSFTIDRSFDFRKNLRLIESCEQNITQPYDFLSKGGLIHDVMSSLPAITLR